MLISSLIKKMSGSPSESFTNEGLVQYMPAPNQIANFAYKFEYRINQLILLIGNIRAIAELTRYDSGVFYLGKVSIEPQLFVGTVQGTFATFFFNEFRMELEKQNTEVDSKIEGSLSTPLPTNPEV